jgi:hypothetical protein
MEKVISELKVIETDEGFRIEMKGDKNHMKSFMRGFKGHKKWNHWGRGRGISGWGPYAFPPAMWMHMGPCWEDWKESPEEGETQQEETKV